MLAGSRFVDERSAIVAGPLAPLAGSLAADLDRLLSDEDVFVPPEKARMTRNGGRCVRDGAFLEFDPRSARQHRCPMCGTMYEGEDHYRWWIMGYQLWLAERAVHAATLWRLGGDDRQRRRAEAILGALADRYLGYPNEDNVLGPTRVFFSTYLESIWTLQLAVAVWLLERNGESPIGGLVRVRILTPSSELIASFNEGLSNRQVWNSAALGAAGVLLQRPALIERALFGTGGLTTFLQSGLLSDGSWYEGENYHLFAHRGLWYLMTLANHVGAALPPELVRRFDLGFAAPLKTALPDFTFPARRDSQYRASLRQWRIAESLELGLARTPDSRELAGGLGVLYGEGPSGDTARWRSTAEAERNVPGVRLARADLGWKSLLFALPNLPEARSLPHESALMSGQGFGVIRCEPDVYVALDYGHTGGSHGHPDRLNLWLVIGDQRVFEDAGTGSYVDRTLHWYRSTLAHNAPLIDGRSQEPVTGSLRAWDEHDGFAWIDAEAAIADGVLVRRTVVVGEGHLVDRLEWRSTRDITLDLPMHIDGDTDADWKPEALVGGSGLEDGFDFVSNAEKAEPSGGGWWLSAPGVFGALLVDVAHSMWRAVAPGPPGQPPRPFLMVRARGASGCITSAWSWTRGVSLGVGEGNEFSVRTSDRVFVHRPAGETWQVTSPDGRTVTLAGARESLTAPRRSQVEDARPVITVPRVSVANVVGDLTTSGQGLRFQLAEAHYRRTEATWSEAGAPTALVTVAATETDLLIEVSVTNHNPNFMPARDENPLDNESPDVNSDGVQVHIRGAGTGSRTLSASWLLVPQTESSKVRVTGRDDAAAIPLEASWRRTPSGWELLVRIRRSALGPPDAHIGLDVIINEMPRWRERRRGQLVLSGAARDWAYLRGDRQDAERLLPMVVRDA